MTNYSFKLRLFISSALFSFTASALTGEQTNTILQQLNTAPNAQSYNAAFQTHSEHALELLETMLKNKSSNTALPLQSAFQARADLAVDIAALARKYYLEPSVIAGAAILSGIDPTKIAQPTASDEKSPYEISELFYLDPPTRLATGGNGGGGLDVISAN